MKKKLIVSGCSFTDKNFESLHPDYDCSFPKWPEILADNLGMDCINRGACGAGNHYIYSTLLDEIIRTPKEEIGLVIPAWSQVQREDYQVYMKYIFPRSHNDSFYKNMTWLNNRLHREGNIFYWMIDQLRRYSSFQFMCQAYDISYKQFQMLTPFEGYLHGLRKTDQEVKDNIGNPDFSERYEYKETIETTKKPFYQEDRRHILKLISEYEKYIDTDNFIGWAPTPKLGGFAIEQKVLMNKNLQTQQDLCISEYDFHPNKRGHELIAEYLYGQLV